MSIKSCVALLAAAALAASPSAATAQPSGAVEVTPQAEQVQDAEALRRRGGLILPLVVLAAIIAAVLLLTKDQKEPSISA